MESNIKDEIFFTRGFSLGDWQVRPLAGILEKSGHQVHLEPKVMEVLVCLARHQGDVVTRDVLLAEVWGKVVVTDDAITRCVSELRTVLGDTDRERTYIRTIPRRGYSLLVPVIPSTGNGKNGSTIKQITDNFGENETDPGSTGLKESNDGAILKHKFWRLGNSVSRASLFIIITVLIIVFADVLINREKIINSEVSATTDTDNIVFVSKPSPRPEPKDAKTAGEIDSVAVLPFANLSANPQYEYFSEGLTEDIRNALLTATKMRVAARTSSTVFKDKAMDVRDIAAQLNVDALLEGTVRISNERMRITAQLTDAGSGYSIWAASFERDLADKVILQTEVAEEIVKQLAPSLENEAHIIKTNTSNVRAHDFYLLGRHHWHKRTAESLEQAHTYFQRALALDPDYALAHSGLADALLFQTIYGNKTIQDVREQAEAAIRKALDLEPELAEAHASLGILKEQIGDMEAALDAYQKAVNLKPQYSMAQMWLGNAWFEFRNAINGHRHYEEALKVDPLHPSVQFNYIHSLKTLGRYDEALRAIELFSQTSSPEKILMMEQEIKLALGRYDEVLRTAVGHTFTGEYKPYASGTVIEALIRLQRYDEAERILADNFSAIDDMLSLFLQINLAVASRDTDRLNGLAEKLASPEFELPHKLTRECADGVSVYLSGVSQFLAKDYETADSTFRQLENRTISGHCYLKEPAVGLLTLLYHASTRFKLRPSDAVGQDLLRHVRSQLDEYRSLGWHTPKLLSADIALHLMEGDEPGAIRLIRSMTTNGWQPFGQIRVLPLFDDYLNSDKLSSDWLDMAQDYQQTRIQCDSIELAKLGL